jgi:dDENN domain
LIKISANNCLRASFVNRFAQLFCQIDAFICYPPSGKYSNVDQWLAQRSTTKNFDRTMFIADQPKPHVPFLLAFMETQSFVSFIDSKIAAKFNEDQHLFGLTSKHLQVKIEIEFGLLSTQKASTL